MCPQICPADFYYSETINRNRRNLTLKHTNMQPKLEQIKKYYSYTVSNDFLKSSEDFCLILVPSWALWTREFDLLLTAVKSFITLYVLDFQTGSCVAKEKAKELLKINELWFCVARQKEKPGTCKEFPQLGATVDQKEKFLEK